MARRVTPAGKDAIGAVVVGTGFGARVHVPALRAAGFRVAALVGENAGRTERRAARLAVPRALTSVAEALRLPEVFAVTVATPPATHAGIVREAIAAGKHVLCEKPFTLGAAEAASLLEAASAAGVTHRLGFEFRWSPERALFARSLAAGAVGEPRLAAFVALVSLLASPGVSMPAWWWDEAAGGGWLGASGSHAVDQIRTALGEIEWVSAALSHAPGRGAVAEDGFTVLFRTRSGVDGVLQQSGSAPGPASAVTRVTGTRGSLWIEGGEVWIGDDRGARRLPMPDDLMLPAPAEASDDPRQRFTHLEIGPYTRLCESFRDGILGRAPAPGSPAPPTFADGLASMQVLDAIRLSAAGRRRVEVPGRAT